MVAEHNRAVQESINLLFDDSGKVNIEKHRKKHQRKQKIASDRERQREQRKAGE